MNLLGGEFQAFRAAQRLAIARAVAEWIQAQAREHYVRDGSVDRWPLVEEALTANGDDCDGLAIVAVQLLRDLGFQDREIYLGIVHRASDGQHHMVTLWFEDPGDPRVIDPTGIMARGLPRMSEVSGWLPLKLFTEHEEYTVRPRYARVPSQAGVGEIGTRR